MIKLNLHVCPFSSFLDNLYLLVFFFTITDKEIELGENNGCYMQWENVADLRVDW